MIKRLLPLFLLFFLFSCSKSSLNDISQDSNLAETNSIPIPYGSLSTTYALMPENSVLTGQSYAAILDSVTKWHNEFQTYALSALLAANFNITDTLAVKTLINQKKRLSF